MRPPGPSRAAAGGGARWCSRARPAPGPAASSTCRHLHHLLLFLFAASSGPSHLQPRCRGGAVAAESEGEYQRTGECCPAVLSVLHGPPAPRCPSPSFPRRFGSSARGEGAGCAREAPTPSGWALFARMVRARALKPRLQILLLARLPFALQFCPLASILPSVKWVVWKNGAPVRPQELPKAFCSTEHRWEAVWGVWEGSVEAQPCHAASLPFSPLGQQPQLVWCGCRRSAP